MGTHGRLRNGRSRGARRFAIVVLLGVMAASRGAPGGYRMTYVTGPGAVARLRSDLGAEGFAAILAVNRVDAFHAARLDSLVVPTEPRSLLELSPFPQVLAAAASMPSLLLISARIQAFAAYDSGRLVRWGPLSSGDRSSPTPAGEYRANWKARRHVSSFDSTWVLPWCVNLDGTLGTALHAYSLPGRPASHCCIRLLESDAHWIHDWIVIGLTPVFVLDTYDFDAPPPWRRLPADPGACDVRIDLVESAIGRPGSKNLTGMEGG